MRADTEWQRIHILPASSYALRKVSAGGRRYIAFFLSLRLMTCLLSISFEARMDVDLTSL